LLGFTVQIESVFGLNGYLADSESSVVLTTSGVCMCVGIQMNT